METHGNFQTHSGLLNLALTFDQEGIMPKRNCILRFNVAFSTCRELKVKQTKSLKCCLYSQKSRFHRTARWNLRSSFIRILNFECLHARSKIMLMNLGIQSIIICPIPMDFGFITWSFWGSHQSSVLPITDRQNSTREDFQYLYKCKTGMIVTS